MEGKDKDLKNRTKSFAIRIIKFVQYINEHGSIAAKVIANKQLFVLARLWVLIIGMLAGVNQEKILLAPRLPTAEAAGNGGQARLAT
jgi:hypothetical protein